MNKKSNWKRRSILILVLGTLVMGSILTGLAVQEAEREKLTRERDLKRELQKGVDLLSDEIDSLISRLETEILSEITSLNNQEDAGELKKICQHIAEEEDLIADIFFVEGQKQPFLPLRNPLIFQSERKRISALNMKKISERELFQTAEAAEFVQQDLGQAIQAYQRLTYAVSEKQSMAIVMNRLARSYLKSSDMNRALKIYRSILDDYSQELSEEGRPLGIFAYVQISLITQKTQPENLEKVLLEFADCLLSSEWPLDKDLFQSYWNRIHTMRMDLFQ